MNAVWGALAGVVIVALSGLAGTIAAQRIIARTTRAVAEDTNAIEGKKVDLSVLQGSVDDLLRRLGTVESNLEHEREQRKLSNGYARTLAQVLRDHHMAVPAPPADLDLP